MIPISDSLASLINAQIGRELGNSHLYKQFASYCHVMGLKHIEKFFATEAEGEQGHAGLLSSLLDNANIQIAIPDIPAKPSSFSGCDVVAQLYSEAEVETTDHLDQLYRAAEEEGNIGVSNVLQGMLEEQIEEQGLTERFANSVKLAGGNLILLDLAFE